MNIVEEIETYLNHYRVSGLEASSLDVQSELEPVSDKGKALEELSGVCSGCTACRLSEKRTNVVFGYGNPDADLVFVGEGPGEQEDLKGEPFVGPAGELLTAAITRGMKLKREDVYIANVVKCRPPGNRAPNLDEVAECLPYLEKQLGIIQPKVIVTLGNPAQRAITGLDAGITKVRGSWLEWKNIKVMPTFHPAYILRNESAKKPFWEDLKAVMQELDL